MAEGGPGNGLGCNACLAVDTVLCATAVVVLGYWLMHTPPLVRTGLRLCLVPLGGCRSGLVVVSLAFRLVVTSVVIVLLAVLVFLLLLWPGRGLRVVLGAVVGEVLMLVRVVLLVLFVVLFVVLHWLRVACFACYPFRLSGPSS